MAITIPTLGVVNYEPCKPYRTIAGGSGVPQQMRLAEDATQTYKEGVPLMFVSGVLQECAFSSADIVVGFSAERGHNLTTADTAEAGYSEGTARNQASSRIIPPGAWMKDGKCGVFIADENTIFSIALKATQTFSNALLVAGTLYGITKDSTSGFWYLDTADTSGNNAVLELIGMDPSSPNTSAGGCRVLVRVAAAKRYFN